jgi:hypothetical protein
MTRPLLSPVTDGRAYKPLRTLQLTCCNALRRCKGLLKVVALLSCVAIVVMGSLYLVLSSAILTFFSSTHSTPPPSYFPNNNTTPDTPPPSSYPSLLDIAAASVLQSRRAGLQAALDARPITTQPTVASARHAPASRIATTASPAAPPTAAPRAAGPGRPPRPAGKPAKSRGKVSQPPPLPEQLTEDIRDAPRRQAAVRREFAHAWHGYERVSMAGLHDEVRPVSNESYDDWGGFGATLVDGLDTLMLMGFTDEVRTLLTFCPHDCHCCT